jgi:hypothetical protein
MSAHRTTAASQSLTTEPSSPPTYWIGLLTCGSNGSSRSNTPFATPTVTSGPQRYAATDSAPATAGNS